ncbi:MAG: winged helix-turn-helix domain-containing protein, partial [Candidatus Nanohaloarchaea archaeon]
DTLKDQGKATARKLLQHTSNAVDQDTVNQAIGWLAKEGKITVEHRDGKIRYELETH